MGLKILGNIDLEQFKKPKKLDSEKKDYSEILNSGLEKMSQKINDSFGYFLKNDGSVAMDSPGYKFFDKDLDQEYIDKREAKFASDSNKTREEWTGDRERVPGIVTEKVLTLILNKVLGDNFIISRTATYDDYRHGVDTLIIDKNTGTPVCGVDEMGSNDQYSYRNKGQKIYDIIGHNGAFVKYGATFKHGKLQQKSIRNVPAFYLSLDGADLEKVLPAISGDEISEVELGIFQRILNSFDNQIFTLYKDHINLKEDIVKIKTELLLENEELKETFGVDDWGKTDEGRDWKNRMGQNNMRLNLLNFQKSLQQMKETYQKIKKQ